MLIEIRKVEQSELGKCLEVIHTSFAPVASRFHISEVSDPTYSAYITLERLIFETLNGVEMYCACDGDEIIGFVGVDKRESEAIINRVCVLPKLQNRNYGTMLIRYALSKAVEMGYKRASVATVDSDDRLKAFFVKEGFCVDCRREFPHVPYTVCFMYKELSDA